MRSFLSDITKMICAEQISVTFRCLLKPAFTINVSNTERMEGTETMTTILLGLGLLILTLAIFSLFSFKAPKGAIAMSGMANAAVATFLVEAVLRYIFGDLFGIEFLGEVGTMAGTMAGVAAAILVPIAMGVSPVFAVIGGVAVGGYGILPGFLAGYAMGFLAPLAEKHLPNGLDTIFGAFLLAPIARLIAFLVDPAVNTALTYIGAVITAATEQSPIVMGFLLGGILKMICTSPLSSMALTAMLGLTGLPMGIAAIACFGGAFSNGILFARLKLGDRSSIIAVMLEPLTQAHIITRYPIPVYASSFLGGALSGIPAALLGIIDNAPGTASPIPGLLAPFAFNTAGKVILALAISVVMGCLGGLIGSVLFKRFTVESPAAPETDAMVLPQAAAAASKG